MYRPLYSIPRYTQPMPTFLGAKHLQNLASYLATKKAPNESIKGAVVVATFYD